MSRPLTEADLAAPAPARPAHLVALDRARQALADRYGVPISHITGRTPAELDTSARALATRRRRAIPTPTRKA